MANLNPTFSTATTHAGATQWLAELSHAIQAGDDHGLWKLMSEREDQDEAHHRLATQVARLAYRIGESATLLRAVPEWVIEIGHGSVLGNENLWRQADICMGEALDGWLPAQDAENRLYRRASVRLNQALGSRSVAQSPHQHSTGRPEQQARLCDRRRRVPARSAAPWLHLHGADQRPRMAPTRRGEHAA